MVTSKELMEMESRYGAHNYHPIPVVISKAEGVYVWDVEGNRYIDMLSCYSALNQGHRHPRVIEAAKKQLDTLTLTSRAFYNDQLGPFLKKITTLSQMEMGLPMGHAIAFTITGNAICLTSIAIMIPAFGRRATIIMTVGLFAGTILSGALINLVYSFLG